MVDEFNYTNILKGDYDFDTSKYFFNADAIRVIIIIYIIISFIVNILYFITSLKTNFKKSIHKINLILMGNVLFINFFHTFSYLYEWVLQNEDGNKSLYVKNDGTICMEENCKDKREYNEIGGLMVGNMISMSTCKAQGFFLVFSALSQDIIIIIFFYLVNKSSKLSRAKVIFLLSAGYLIALIISVIYLVVDGFGLNDKYCFIKKFNFIKKDKPQSNTYELYSKFDAMIIIYYLIRLIFLIISSCLLYKIVRYISKNKLRKIYIVKVCSFLISQIFTVFVGIMYRFGGLISAKFSRDFANVFLVINTLDGLIFPLFSYFSNNMYKNLCCKESNEEFSNDFLSADDTNNDMTATNMTLNNQAKNGDKSGISTKNNSQNKNNFDVSYLPNT